MKNKIVLLPLLCFGMLAADAQQKNNKTNKNTTSTNTTTTTTNTTNQTTGNNQSNTTTGTHSDHGTMNDAGGQLTSTGRYQAMGVQTGSLHKKDMKFIMVAHSSNMLEIESSRLALQNGSSQAVKDYAQMMIEHHTMAGQQMKQMLSSKGVMIPDTAMLDRYRSKIEMLRGLQGADFDKAYIRIMVDAHEEDLDEYEDEITDARDADIRAFTAKMMPTLRTHYTRAREIRKQL
jgi:putative membrane protein